MTKKPAPKPAPAKPKADPTPEKKPAKPATRSTASDFPFTFQLGRMAALSGAKKDVAPEYAVPDEAQAWAEGYDSV